MLRIQTAASPRVAVGQGAAAACTALKPRANRVCRSTCSASYHRDTTRAVGTGKRGVVLCQAAASTTTATQEADTWEAGPLEPLVRPTTVDQPYPGVWTFTQPWELPVREPPCRPIGLNPASCLTIFGRE